VPSFASGVRRIGLAFRILFDPIVKPGRLLGSDDNGEEAAVAGIASPCPSDTILVLDACSLCGGAARTLVGEFNRFVHFAQPPDEESLRADYCLCHDCGSVYASRRPAGRRYRWLLDHFEDALHRAQASGRKFALSSSALSDEDRTHLRRLAARGVFVSEHTHPSRKEYLPALLSDRLAASAHVEILGSLIDLQGRRVLEVRSRLGSISAALRRLYSADVFAMSMFEGQRLLIGEVYGIPTSEIDFDRFELPAQGQWDLVVCNHMLTHAVRPKEMLRVLRARLAPGGHAYFYNEPDDAEILVDGKSMFSTLNAFHLQTFDAAAFVRALAASGFEPVFLTHHEGNIVCLARAVDVPAALPQMTASQLKTRREAYLRARDAALLMLPERARHRVGSEWSSVVDRALDTGVAEPGPDGQIRVRRQPK
jgi:2-polyprenyl-3-methyl-5-hydroxy-6-metoxy-1,4-benzoquinol methylase